MVVRVTLNEPLGADLGPFNLTANVGNVSPPTATRTELLGGLDVTVDNIATQLLVTSTGTCVNSVTLNIIGLPVPLSIVANDDTAGPINGELGGDAGINVLSNDFVNGVTATTSSVTVTSTPTGPLTVNSDGTVDIAPNTVAGTYTIDYTICEIANPTNCDTATVTVTVEDTSILIAGILLLGAGTDCSTGDPATSHSNVIWVPSSWDGFTLKSGKLVVDNGDTFTGSPTTFYNPLDPAVTIDTSQSIITTTSGFVDPTAASTNFLVQNGSLNVVGGGNIDLFTDPTVAEASFSVCF